MEYEIIGGKRVNSTLLYSINEKILYVKKSSHGHKIYYSCYTAGCKSRVILKHGICKKNSALFKHEHEDHVAVYDELKALNNIKRKCLDMNNMETSSALSSIRKAFQDECKINQQGTKNIDLAKIQRGLQYLTSNERKQPKIPADVVKLFQCKHVLKNFGMSLHKNDGRTPFFKVYYEDVNFAYCIFESNKSIELIKTYVSSNFERKIIIDGLFSILVIDCFKYLMVINIEYAEEMFPFMFVLLTTKSSKCFAHIFSYIKVNIFNLDGAVFVTDYDMSLREAIRAEFPNSKTLGCWFYFCQAMKRHITTNTKELFSYIQQDENATLQYHKLLLLPLLPLDQIFKYFMAIKGDIEKLNQCWKFTTFLNYYENQWLLQVGVEELSLFGTLIRTSSALEIYNEVLSQNCIKQKNFFKFVKFLQNEEFNKSKRFDLLLNSISVVGEIRPIKSVSEKVYKIEKAYDDLRMEIITTAMFLNWLALPNNGVCAAMEQSDETFCAAMEQSDEKYCLEDIDDQVDEQDDKMLLQSTLQLVQPGLCVICQIAEPNIEMIPCRHSNICNVCVLKLQADAIGNGLEKFYCPGCHQEVDDTLQVVL